MDLKKAKRALPLAALSATEMLVPFVRMFILTHLLGPFEFGFSAALSAAYATVEQITDTGLFRFVLAAPRDRYKEALRTAHGIALVRGLLVALLFVAIAYPTSCAMVTCSNWSSFVWLAPLTFIKSFENLELRVYERDYRYWPQLFASILSHSAGMTALLLIGWESRTHEALIAYLLVQSLAYVALTHLLAHSRFSFVLNGPLTRDALRFSLPLMANGAGLALMGQGDRLFVGAALGLETLGLYAVMILTAYVPTAALFRLIGPIQFAGLINSTENQPLYYTRLTLYSRAIPMIAAFYALGWIVLGKDLVPIVFGGRFVISDLEMLLVGLLVYARICRTEPATSVLIQTHNTRRLALVNQLPMFGLGLGVLFTSINPSLASLLLGTSTGEVVSLAVMLFTARRLYGTAFGDAVMFCAAFLAVPTIVGLFFVLQSGGSEGQLITRIGIGLIGTSILGLCAWLALMDPIRRSYGKGAGLGQSPVAAE